MAAMAARIISASRRTDLPALHASWLMARLRAGFVDVVNPMNARQVERVSLAPDDVAALVLWTRHPRPLRPHLGELAERCGPPLWLVTLTGYPRWLEPRAPATRVVVEELHRLAERFGPAAVHWRYDPVVLSSRTPAAYHEQQLGQLAEQLRGATRACHLSFLDRDYRKTRRRLAALEQQGIRFDAPGQAERRALAMRLAELLRAQGIAALACCEPELADPAQGDLLEGGSGWRTAGCIDRAWVREVTGREPVAPPRPTRTGCLCCASKDIGAYDSCSLGCVYCYATRSDAAGRAGRRALRAEHPPRLPLPRP